MSEQLFLYLPGTLRSMEFGKYRVIAVDTSGPWLSWGAHSKARYARACTEFPLLVPRVLHSPLPRAPI